MNIIIHKYSYIRNCLNNAESKNCNVREEFIQEANTVNSSNKIYERCDEYNFYRHFIQKHIECVYIN